MTTVRYLWRGGGEEKVVNTLPEAKKLVTESGGSFELIYDEKLSQSESYCRPGASYATDRWKNYKF